MKFSKNKGFRKVVLIISLSFSVIAGVVVWLRHPETRLSTQMVLMIAGVVLVAGFALVLAFGQLRSVKQKLPIEDEFSKSLKRKGAAASYYISLYLWLALMMFETKISLERHALIGAGLLGMAAIYAGSWLYFRYFSRAQ